MVNTQELVPRLMSKSKRNDEPVKLDREVLRLARIVAAYRGIPIAEYLSERLRPLAEADYEEEVRAEEARKVATQPADPPADAPKPSRRKKPEQG
jgi:hypothetical protein